MTRICKYVKERSNVVIFVTGNISKYFFELNDLLKIEDDDFNVTLVCDDDAHKGVMCACS